MIAGLKESHRPAFGFKVVGKVTDNNLHCAGGKWRVKPSWVALFCRWPPALSIGAFHRRGSGENSRTDSFRSEITKSTCGSNALMGVNERYRCDPYYDRVRGSAQSCRTTLSSAFERLLSFRSAGYARRQWSARSHCHSRNAVGMFLEKVHIIPTAWLQTTLYSALASIAYRQRSHLWQKATRNFNRMFCKNWNTNQASMLRRLAPRPRMALWASRVS